MRNNPHLLCEMDGGDIIKTRWNWHPTILKTGFFSFPSIFVGFGAVFLSWATGLWQLSLPCVLKPPVTGSQQSHSSAASRASTAHGYQQEGCRSKTWPSWCHQEVPNSPGEASWAAALGAVSQIPEVFLLWAILTSLLFFVSPQGALVCASQTFHVCSCSDSLVVVSREHSWTVNSLILADPSSSESSPRAWYSPLDGTDRTQLLYMWSLSSQQLLLSQQDLTAHFLQKHQHSRAPQNNPSSCFPGFVDADTTEWDIWVPVPFSFLQTPFNSHLILFTFFLFKPNDSFKQLSQLPAWVLGKSMYTHS